MADEKSGQESPITPYLYYEDVARALQWLSRTFGFVERKQETISDSDGQVVHAAMELNSGTIFIGFPGGDYKNPKRLGQTTQNLYVYVDDLQKHFENTKLQGANVLSDLEETFYGDRRYGVEDLEGHQWYFAEKVRDLAPGDWKPSQEDLKGHE